MLVFRLARRKYIRDLSGTGARLYGGRWNNKGIAMVYTSDTPSLAALEVLVHLSPQTLPPDYCLATFVVPDDIKAEALAAGDLPRNWRDYPSPAKLAKIGSDWAQSGCSLVLAVPSVIIPAQQNILINPQHADMKRVSVVRVEPFQFDKRLVK